MKAAHTPFTPVDFAKVSVAALLAVLAWDASGLDLALASWFGTPTGFPLVHNWWLQNVLHNGLRQAGWALFAVLVVMVWWPLGPLQQISLRSRVGLVLGVALAALAVQLIKRASGTSCPWDLASFGGTASYVSHWQWGVRDGGGGHCFPAGHASTGFAFLSGWFWLRRSAPKAAMAWLVCALVLGFGLGLVQQMRGAHYLSHTLWTAWICWTFGLVVEICVQQYFRAKKASALESNPIQESLQ